MKYLLSVSLCVCLAMAMPIDMEEKRALLAGLGGLFGGVASAGKAGAAAGGIGGKLGSIGGLMGAQSVIGGVFDVAKSLIAHGHDVGRNDPHHHGAEHGAQNAILRALADGSFGH